MAPKKNAKRAIQVPAEEEPPAKKLQTLLRRHSVKESVYRHVADVFSHPAAAQLPQDCKDMFLGALPFSLVVAADERNEFQTTFVEMADKALTKVLAGMQESLDSANESLTAVASEKGQMEQKIQCAEEELKSAQAHASEKRAALATAGAAVAEAKAKVNSAKEAQAAQQRTTAAAAEDKAALLQAVGTGGSFGRLKAGDWVDGEAEKIFLMLEPLVLKKLQTDSSLTTAMRCTLLKKPESRGQFDAMLLEELEKAFSARIDALETDLSAAGYVAAELAETVAAATAALELATTGQQEASAALASSSSAEKAPAAALQAAKATLQEFKPKHMQASNRRNIEQQRLQKFVDLNVSAFQELRDRVSASKAKEMADKACKDEVAKVELKVQTSSGQDAKLADGEVSLASPEVGGA